MNSIEPLRERHLELLGLTEDLTTSEEDKISEVEGFAKNICEAGVYTIEPKQREQLRMWLRYWQTVIFNYKGIMPLLELLPLSIDCVKQGSETSQRTLFPSPGAEGSNPFIYGRPVTGKEFFNRTNELRAVFNRLRNGESTAIVGAPHIGKTSLLLQMRDKQIQTKYLGGYADALIVIYLDMHDIGNSYTPEGFWNDILELLLEMPECTELSERVQSIAHSGDRRRTLKQLFNYIEQQHQCLVLMLDEFERLLTHPNFQDSAFWGLLRTLATTTGGLALVLGSRLTVAEMNERGKTILENGSPFFNNIIAIHLTIFDAETVDKVLDQAETEFSPEDRQLICRIAGRTPFMLQAIAAAMFETEKQQRQTRPSEYFYARIFSHLEELWDILDDYARTAFVLLALVTSHSKLVQEVFPDNQINQIDTLNLGLNRLAAMGLAEEVVRVDQYPEETTLDMQNKQWRIVGEVYVWWVRDILVTRVRLVANFMKWMSEKRYLCLFTQEQWDKIVTGARQMLNY